MIYVITDDQAVIRFLGKEFGLHEVQVVDVLLLNRVLLNRIRANDTIFIDFSYFNHPSLDFRSLLPFTVYFIRYEGKSVQLLDIKDIQKLSGKRLMEWINATALRCKSGDTTIPFIIQDPRMMELLKYIRKVARLDTSVLLLGETGTGKEFIARYIYEHSPRRDKPFIAVNCSAIPHSLMESELFGFKKGSFTGADRDYPGKFMLAHEGTIFLDEIGDLPLDVQPKLLRVLDYGEIETIGEVTSKKVNVRLITATNRNLYEMVEYGEFRLDLLYRINSFSIAVPPLRERPEDIIPLFLYYLKYFEEKYRLTVSLERENEIHRLLLGYEWPGNIRELKNLCQQLVVLYGDDGITPEIVEEVLGQNQKNLQRTPGLMKQAVIRTEQEMIQETLKRCENNIRRAAELLGISRQHLYRKIKKYGINPGNVQ